MDQLVDEEGQLDISDYLGNSGSFLLVPIVVTEPAVGYGGGFGMVFLQPREDQGEAGWRRPNITGLGGLATQNRTKGGAIVDMRYWKEGELKSKAGLMATSVNLDIYGFANESDNPVPRRYNLEVAGGQLALEHNLPIEHASLQLAYSYMDVSAQLEAGQPPARFQPAHHQSEISSLNLSLIYDSRDNLFSPQTGFYSRTSFVVTDEFIGASLDFQKLSQVLIVYRNIHDDWTLGLKLDGQAVFGDFPFYAKPFVTLRGVPAMRYQGECVAFAEVEIQRRLNDRWRLLGFMGGGASWDDLGPINNDQSVISGGVGFRYRIARKFGLDVGVDVATSGDDSAIYLQMGSAWLRM